MDVHHAAYIDRFAPDIDIIDKKTANNQGCVKYITFPLLFMLVCTEVQYLLPHHLLESDHIES